MRQLQDILSDLVGIPSVTGQEQAILEYVNSFIKSANHTHYSGDTWSACFVKGKSSSRALMLNGHVDTVPPGPLTNWQTDPFTLTETEEGLVGLGSSDMKSGIAVMLDELQRLKSEELEHDMWFVFVAGEEVNAIGARDFIQWYKGKKFTPYKELTILVAEPTNADFIGVGHRGHAVYEISIAGQSGHGSAPALIKDHAIKNTYKVIQALEKKSLEWQKLYSHPKLGKPSLAIGAMTTGSNVSKNKFPDACTISVDIRPTPELSKNLEREVAEVLSAVGVEMEVHPILPFYKACYSSPEDNYLVTSLLKLDSTLTVDSFTGATDLSFLTELSDKFAIYGPGDCKKMHQSNEVIKKDGLQRASKVISQLVRDY